MREALGRRVPERHYRRGAGLINDFGARAMLVGGDWEIGERNLGIREGFFEGYGAHIRVRFGLNGFLISNWIYSLYVQ